MEDEAEAERLAKKEQKRRKRRIKAGLDPDIHTSDEEEDLRKEKTAEISELVFVERSVDETRGAAIYNLDMKFENQSELSRQRVNANEKSRRSVEDTRLSHYQDMDLLKQLGFSNLDIESKKEGEEGADGNPSFEFDGEEPFDQELFEKLKQQDIRDIDRLQLQMDEMQSRITIRDINDLTSVGKSFRGSTNLKKEFYQMSMRPTILSDQSRKRNINDLQEEIDRHQKEIQLLKQKLEFKTKIENYRVLRPPSKDVKWEKVDVQEIWELGVKKVQRDTKGECIIF